jgi:hypothetical protein
MGEKMWRNRGERKIARWGQGASENKRAWLGERRHFTQNMWKGISLLSGRRLPTSSSTQICSTNFVINSDLRYQLSPLRPRLLLSGLDSSSPPLVCRYGTSPLISFVLPSLHPSLSRLLCALPSSSPSSLSSSLRLPLSSLQPLLILCFQVCVAACLIFSFLPWLALLSMPM